MRQKTGRQAKAASSKIPADPTRWSESSRRSYAVGFTRFYEDRPWTCRGCGQADVFTAQAQKQAFEVDHVYIGYRPGLCAACKAKKQHLADSIRRDEARWKAHKQALQHDLAFLKDWLARLEAYAQVGGRRNHDVIAMLRRLLQPQPG